MKAVFRNTWVPTCYIFAVPATRNHSKEAMTMDDDTTRNLFIRICRDGNFKLSLEQVASMTGSILKIHPLSVAGAFPFIDDARKLADGSHRFYETNKS